MAEVDVVEFKNAREFLEYLRPSADRWWSQRSAADYVFRGHSDVNYLLVPNAVRRSEEPIDLDRIAQHLQMITPGLDEVTAVHYAIAEVMRSLATVARSVGIDQVAEASELNDPFSSFELQAQLQHYGGNTLLLDWTRSPLVAAAFAAKDDGTTDICVWALNRDKFGELGMLAGIRKDGGSVELVLQDAPIVRNRYLIAQSGTFTYLRSHNSNEPDKIDWDPLERLHEHSAQCALVKIVLCRSEVAALRELLYRENISMAHLKPDLGNAVQVAVQRCLRIHS
ncbi:FRG domain-containing protein [Rhizobium sp. SL42]|uniref:FRG domain-containing protein n=1 Tax=Rhizobium sp. SL42 TaxID=2806346 RepID=UPI001F157EF6|nr:FRG domain-containing protein [Rhizobium sp. SL42]UJW74193.1 FRG domain-containing protein [Rhizobium sp. SL42]